MPASGYVDIAVTSYDTLRFSWWENSQSIANNETNVGWQLSLIAGAYGLISSSASKAWSANINGSPYSGNNTIGIGNNTTKTLASGTTTVKHNSDGSKNFSFSFSQQFDINFNGWVGTKSGSGVGRLTTIPRASGLSVNGGTLGAEQVITADRKADVFTHTLTWVCGEYSGTLATKSSLTSWKFTPNSELATGAPNGTSVWCSFTLKTFNGNTEIGSVTKGVWLIIPDSVIPSCSIAVSDLSGCLAKYGAYVQANSRLKVDITALGIYNSTIKAYKTTIDGKNYTATTFETDVLSGEGNLTVNTTVTDTRERTATDTENINVLAYNSPLISSITAYRCNAHGERQNNGSYLAVAFNAEITALNNINSAVYKVKYKKRTESENDYVENEIVSLRGKYSIEEGIYIFAAEPSTYDIVVTAEDDFSAVQRNTKGASVKKLISFLKRGFGLAIGKYAESANTVEFELEAKFNNKVYGNGFFDAIYPPGSIYLSMNNINPETLFGGTWERITDAFLWGVDGENEVIGKRGGSKTNTHNHFTAVSFDGNSAYISSQPNLPRTRIKEGVNRMFITAQYDNGRTREDSTYDETINIMPPHINIAIWYRVS